MSHKQFESPAKQEISFDSSHLASNCYSTPVFLSSLNRSSKPKVNFHSIDDLASNNSSFDDSGYLTYFNSFLLSQTLANFNSSVVNTKSESFQSNDKENIEIKLTSCNDGKKLRTTFTDNQKQMLDVYFSNNPYPDPKELEDLSKQLNLPENVIKVWFQNKRSRNKQRKSTNSKLINPTTQNESLLLNNLKLLSTLF